MTAFAVAGALGINPSMSADDMLTGADEKKLAPYVAAFREQDRRSELKKWVNAKLLPHKLDVHDLSRDFSDPALFCALVKAMLPDEASHVPENGCTEADVVKAQAVVQEVLGVATRISPASMMAGRETPKLVEYLKDVRAQDEKMVLLDWVNEKTAPFGVKAENFSEAFRDPAVLGAIVKSFVPSAADPHTAGTGAGTGTFAVANNGANAPRRSIDATPRKVVLVPWGPGAKGGAAATAAAAIAATPGAAAAVAATPGAHEHAVAGAGSMRPADASEGKPAPRLSVGSDAAAAALAAAGALAFAAAMASAEKELGVRTPEGLSPAALVEGAPEEEVLAYVESFRVKEREEALLASLNDQISPYEVQAEKFTDPKALCSLVKTYDPRAVNLSLVTPRDAESELRKAMAVADSKLGVTPVANVGALLTEASGEVAICYVEELREQARKKELLNWLNSKLRPVGVVAKGFGDTFSDPKVLCGLVKAFAPLDVELDKVTAGSAVREVGKAMEVAEAKLGVASSLNPKQLLSGANADAVADYVSDFRELERKEGLLAWLNDRVAPYELNAKDFDMDFEDPRVLGALVRVCACKHVCDKSV
jgi:hypothetical protein